MIPSSINNEWRIEQKSIPLLHHISNNPGATERFPCELFHTKHILDAQQTLRRQHACLQKEQIRSKSPSGFFALRERSMALQPSSHPSIKAKFIRMASLRNSAREAGPSTKQRHLSFLVICAPQSTYLHAHLSNTMYLIQASVKLNWDKRKRRNPATANGNSKEPLQLCIST